MRRPRQPRRPHQPRRRSRSRCGRPRRPHRPRRERRTCRSRAAWRWRRRSSRGHSTEGKRATDGSGLRRIGGAAQKRRQPSRGTRLPDNARSDRRIAAGQSGQAGRHWVAFVTCAGRAGCLWGDPRVIDPAVEFPPRCSPIGATGTLHQTASPPNTTQHHVRMSRGWGGRTTAAPKARPTAGDRADPHIQRDLLNTTQHLGA